MISRLLLQMTGWIFFSALLLFVPAGTLAWPGAWIYLFLQTAFGLGTGFWLAKHDPALLRERLSFLIQARQPLWDKVIMAVFMCLMVVWLPVMALDAVRYQLSSVPVVLKIMSALGLLAAFYIIYRVFKENTYTSPVVRIQKERGHKIITTGPYRYVRHPMYAAAFLFFISTPLMLGSWYGLIVTGLLIILLAIRTYKEEQVLIKEFSEHYRAYTRQVRYLFIPFFW
ncbi:methyltransferase family protein [Legionella spiritensis]|uniref:Isoprenylcysteine carboxyl methyltransferase (ICMT) family protein n=1 Tax=Legionella spiritensis TaxID=452 RepID=A0A0W0Z9J1_LEGSP|nr:isoprenylcysteine carboxylmethyltransferase family protein [Legionella spiritensis]KTD65761.1 Isoprenylcysteine carboxyl methyltransferase (ICMT) family protein [Legionella spiritensis]SNV42675.1 Putative protein-S-isoprenylcysteine methyltransferase [Legionella spiritensis]